MWINTILTYDKFGICTPNFRIKFEFYVLHKFYRNKFRSSYEYVAVLLLMCIYIEQYFNVFEICTRAKMMNEYIFAPKMTLNFIPFIHIAFFKYLQKWCNFYHEFCLMLLFNFLYTELHTKCIQFGGCNLKLFSLFNKLSQLWVGIRHVFAKSIHINCKKR